MPIDDILKKSSLEVFHGLEAGQLRMLKTISKNSSVTIKLLAHDNLHRCASFDRWGVKKRLEGTNHFVGLMPNDYVFTVPKNKKQKQYRLTLKGFLASLGYVSFEKHNLVKQYKAILLKFLSESESKIILDCIKYEITILLFYNIILGVNWLKFKFTQKHIAKNRTTESGLSHMLKEIDEYVVHDYHKRDLQIISSKFPKIFMKYLIIRGYFSDKRVFNMYKKWKLQRKPFTVEMKKFLVFNIYGDLWYNFIQHEKITISMPDLSWTYLEYVEFDKKPDILKMTKSEYETLFSKK